MKKSLSLLCIIALLTSCTQEIIHLAEDKVEQTVLLRLTQTEGEEIASDSIHCYIFKDHLFYKALSHLVWKKGDTFEIEAPKKAQLYFLTHIEEPASLASLEEEKTELRSFLAMRSDEIRQTTWEAPAFYSGMIDTALDTTRTVKLTLGVAQISIDASTDMSIRIDSVETEGASSNSLLFKGMEADSSMKEQRFLHIFKPAVSGLVSNIFSLYESNTPVDITIKGTYKQTPIFIKKTIEKVERNKAYTLKIEEKDLEVSPSTNVHILTPDSRGRLDIGAVKASQILPGSTLYLNGTFLSVRISGLKGNAQQPIRITNYPGKKLTVGDPTWAGGAYSSAIQLLECQHIIIGSESNASDFSITGTTQSSVQSAYFGLNLRPFTDNIEVKHLIIKDGGTGIMAKTDPEKNNPKTWYPNALMENLSIHDVTIYGTTDAAMYIGHSALWWGWDETGRGYNAGATPNNPSHTYVKPIRWKNVRIHNNSVHHLGYDGIQASAIDQLEISGNEVANFGLRKVQGQCMGIIVGGRTTNTYTHDNYVHDGFGELIQFHGADEGNATHLIQNNLLVNTQGSGIGVYGATDAATVQISNNTVIGCQTYAIQTNGKSFETKVALSDNLFVSYYLKDPTSQKYIWIINHSTVEETNNKRFDTPVKAMIDPDNFYQPLSGSPIGKAGYRRY